MAYQDHFKLADDLITHLDSTIGSISDPFIQSRYTGFVAISAATVYELAIKAIFLEFGQKKHKVLGAFVCAHFNRINGRIKIKILKEDYIPRFGEKYLKRFKKKIEQRQKEVLNRSGQDIKSSYNNLIEWRNQFAHEGRILTTVTYREMANAYQTGKNVIDCLAETMRY